MSRIRGAATYQCQQGRNVVPAKSVNESPSGDCSCRDGKDDGDDKKPSNDTDNWSMMLIGIP